jgi:hypothetical protein
MDLLPSQTCLLGSASIYPILTYILNKRGPHSEPQLQRYNKVNKGLSTLHSSLITALTLHALRQRGWRDPVSSNSASKSLVATLRNSENEDDSRNPFITYRSEFANSITAIETGYLIQDTVALLLQHYYLKDPKLEKVLLLHHIGISSALATLQYYIAHGWEIGIYVIVMFLLMNSSTPLLNLRWYLRKYRSDMKCAIFGVDCAFAAAFFASRVYLVWAILGYYGKHHGKTPLQAYWRLRVPCKVGTGALWMTMTAWWCELMRSIVTRAQNVI